MKILITGISGLLGSAVAKAAYDAVHDLIGVSRQRMSSLLDFKYDLIQKDLQTAAITGRDLEGVDAIIHCAADTTMGSFSNRKQDRMNFEVLCELIEASLGSRVKRFVLVSTANTLYPGSKMKPGTERIKLKSSRKRLNYVNSKIDAEELLLHAVKNRGLNALIVNPTFILNPEYELVSSNQLMKYALKNRLLFHPKGSKNIVDARDVASAIIGAINRGRRGHSYLLSNENISFLEFQRRVKKHQKANAWFLPIPSILLLILATLCTFLEIILKKPQDLNLKSVAHLNADYFYSNQKARLELGFNPRPVDDTLSDFVKKIK